MVLTGMAMGVLMGMVHVGMVHMGMVQMGTVLTGMVQGEQCLQAAEMHQHDYCHSSMSPSPQPDAGYKSHECLEGGQQLMSLF